MGISENSKSRTFYAEITTGDSPVRMPVGKTNLVPSERKLCLMIKRNLHDLIITRSDSDQWSSIEDLEFAWVSLWRDSTHGVPILEN